MTLPFPGFTDRKLRQRPTTRRKPRVFNSAFSAAGRLFCFARPIPKLNSGYLKGYPEVEDTTCQHPYSLAGTAGGKDGGDFIPTKRCTRGRATLLDIQRYRQLPPRNHVNEHRCGGQLVRGHGHPCAVQEKEVATGDKII